MKRILSTLAGAAVALLLTVPAQAQDADIAGKWESTRETQRGVMTTTFTFEVDGTKLTGTVGSQRGDSDISDGTIEGNRISFKMVLTMGDRTIEMVYSGTVEGDTITGTMQTPRGEQPWTAKRVSGS
jgi:hypothetical protein